MKKKEEEIVKDEQKIAEMEKEIARLWKKINEIINHSPKRGFITTIGGKKVIMKKR